MNRRFFLQLSAVAAAHTLLQWRFAGAAPAKTPGAYDAVIVGAGLGGLTCAAYLARHGFKTLLLEQYDVPGGYATSFTRRSDKGTFTCEVSLHSSVLGTGSSRDILTDLGVWGKLDLVPHPNAWSSHFPDFSLEVPSKCGLDGFERQLAALFPAETEGLAAFFTVWRNVMAETHKLERGLPKEAEDQFPQLFPTLWDIHDKTIGQVVDAHVSDPKLKAVLAQSCGYYGLPPSQLSAFYYLLPTGEYITSGGSYIKGTSQTLSNALAKAVTDAGGEIRYGMLVDEILMENGRAVGVRTHRGEEIRARTVVCNASAPQVFGKLLPKGTISQKERARLDSFTNSPGTFIVWLGLDRDITPSFKHSEWAHYASYDLDANYADAMRCRYDNGGFSLMVYDNLVPGFSPKGCTSLCIVSASGYDVWKGMEADYLKEDCPAYDTLKEKLTETLIAQVEKHAIPGLSKMIAMRDSATPLTNLRFTMNTSGAIYGYNQTVENSFMSRLPNRTSVPGLYLASAWGNPGGGYGGVLSGGKGAFREVARELSAE